MSCSVQRRRLASISAFVLVLATSTTCIAAPRALRDVIGEFPASRISTSEHFALKWGELDPVSADEAKTLLDVLETAWAKEIDELGFPAPRKSDTHFVNVYVANTGAPTPKTGTPSYVRPDAEGVPYMVLGSTIRGGGGDFVASTLAHELNHVSQQSSGEFAEGDPLVTRWYREATAEWIPRIVFPKSTYTGPNVSVAEYLLLPHLSVYYWPTTSDALSLEESHDYGASHWVRYAADRAGAGAIAATWKDTTKKTPHDALAALFASNGTTIEDAFADFSARNAVLDYPDGKAIEAQLRKATVKHREDARPIALEIEGLTETQQRPRDELLPRAYGYNVVRIRAAGPLLVRLNGAEKGDLGTPARFRATFVQTEGAVRYRALPLANEREAILYLSELRGPVEGYLVVCAVPSVLVPDETFDYGITVEALPAPPAEEAAPVVAAPATEESSSCAVVSGMAGERRRRIGGKWWPRSSRSVSCAGGEAPASL